MFSDQGHCTSATQSFSSCSHRQNLSSAEHGSTLGLSCGVKHSSSPLAMQQQHCNHASSTIFIPSALLKNAGLRGTVSKAYTKFINPNRQTNHHFTCPPSFSMRKLETSPPSQSPTSAALASAKNSFVCRSPLPIMTIARHTTAR